MRRTVLGLFLAAAAAAQAPPGTPPAATFPASIELVDAEIFGVDRVHSHLGFTIGFLGMSQVRGSFGAWTATILWNEERPERSSVTLAVEAATIDTAAESRDRDLQGEPFFDTARHPRIVFQTTRIEPQGGERYLVHGELTIKGTTRAISIPMTRTVRRIPDPAWGNIRIGVAGEVTLRRRDFGILGNEFWGQALADEVTVAIDILGSRPNYDRWSFPRRDKPPAGEVVWKAVEERGAAAAAREFRELRRAAAEAYDFQPGQLAIVVNRLMQRRRLDDALALLETAIAEYPEEAGFYARAGEAHAAKGDRPAAIRSYEKAQALSPGGTESIEMLRRLRALPEGSR
jgi:polyisoprenoid-binding protein YceI